MLAITLILSSSFLTGPRELVQNLPSVPLTNGVVTFQAEANLGDFTGWTTAVKGELAGGEALEDAKGWIEVQVDSLMTNNGRRDRHMREHLEADRFPLIRFELREVRPLTVAGDTVRVSLLGTLEIHGVKKQVEIQAAVTWDAGGAYARLFPFPLDIRDYGMEAPRRFIIARMNPVVRVRGRLIFGRSNR